MNQNIVIGILIIIVISAGGFAFIQTQNLSELESASTQAVSNLLETGTQFADDTNSRATQSADYLQNIQETATLSASEASVRETQSADDASEVAETATQSLVDTIATGTHFAERVDATANQSASLLATQSALSTDMANNLATRQVELTASALLFSDAQATSSAQMLDMENRLESFGLIGEGLTGVSAEIINNFDLFEGQGYEILLADNFTAGDFFSGKVNDLENALNRVNLDAIFDNLEKQDEGFLFFAVDTRLIDERPHATLSLIRENALTENALLEEYIASALFSLQGEFALITSDIIAINGQATGRIIIDQQFDDVTVRQLQYIFKLENQFYILTFTAPIGEYAKLRESFETSAESLRIRG